MKKVAIKDEDLIEPDQESVENNGKSLYTKEILARTKKCRRNDVTKQVKITYLPFN